jgi:OmpA-OmpF porin, OOP family
MRLPRLSTLRNHPGLLTGAVFVVAALAAVLVAWGALKGIETVSKSAVERALLLEGEDWARVETNGLQVILEGAAPTESGRFHALSIAGKSVDASRVIDLMQLPPPKDVTPPRFAVEILRSEAGISMIGLIPAAADREALGERIQQIDLARTVTDLLETADYPMPEGWDTATAFALDALEMLPRSKISIRADRVAIEAIAESGEQKAGWERLLRANPPPGVRVALDISAPRPVITPFTLRFTLDDEGARFDACTASNEAGRNKIVAAGVAAGVTGQPECPIGLGEPSPDWPEAAALGIAALHDLGGGSLTFSDADVTLVAAEGTPQNSFDRVVGELETELPDVFSLHSVLPDPVTISGTGESDGPPEFVATLSPEGMVQLRGRVADEQERTITESFARAHFGSQKVYAAMRLDPELPRGWSVRTLAALEALSHLANGSVVVQPRVVDVRGATGDTGASAEISRVLSNKLGEAEDFRVNVRYEEALDPVAGLPTPQECAAEINAALTESKITFSPGSAEIESSSARTVDKIAEILKTCPDVAMEIGGYTDSQGREEMNKALSQRRADSVLSALLARRVLTTNLTAFGYGEDNPIADNDTEEGREANRRIEFRLIGDEPAEGEAAETETQDDAETEDTGEADDEEIAPIRPLARPVDLVEEADREAGDAEVADTADGEGSDPADATETDATPQGTEVPDSEPTPDEGDADSTPDEGDEDAAPGDGDEDPTPDEASEDPADATGQEADPETDGEASDTPAQDAAEDPGDAGEAETDAPVVVHPELEGIRPQPRPARDDG